jgi:hypothetical protein
MLGRTLLGYGRIRRRLLHRPRRTVLNRNWRGPVWYPLRRSGRFAQLPPESSGRFSNMAPSAWRMARATSPDIRLACTASTEQTTTCQPHQQDLYRSSTSDDGKAQQPALYLERLGPFFVRRAVWQSHCNDGSSRD